VGLPHYGESVLEFDHGRVRKGKIFFVLDKESIFPKHLHQKNVDSGLPYRAVVAGYSGSSEWLVAYSPEKERK